MRGGIVQLSYLDLYRSAQKAAWFTHPVRHEQHRRR